MADLILIRTALLSVTDKTGIVQLAQALHLRGVQLISTGGTRTVLQDAGLPVTDISAITGNPEAFGGRIKTISFQIASGILFDRDRDADQAASLGVLPIDLVVANLYDFAKYRDQGLPLPALIEHIDIGGPTMIRAAAKNYAHVAVLVRPDAYAEFLNLLADTGGSTSLQARQNWMRDAFALTAQYDTAIAEHVLGEPLRYGENPHQSAVFVANRDGIAYQMLGGKALSYNNLVDLDAALAAVLPMTQPACAVVKHENPCGLASGPDAVSLLPVAWSGDPVSAFGSVIAFNRAVDRAALTHLAMDDKARRKFVEIVAAPAFSPEAVVYLQQNKNLRILRMVDNRSGQQQLRRVLTLGTLVQSADIELAAHYDVVSAAKPAALDRALAEFGLHAVRCLKSNAIAVVQRSGGVVSLLGMGAGQPNRLKSTQLAIAQARDNLRDQGRDVALGMAQSYLASDAFFPFADGVQVALDAGIRTLIEPGGSLRDAEVIAACDASGAVLVFTGTRHFRH